jgi:aminoglycoside/choline kinase family phosphotransferase
MDGDGVQSAIRKRLEEILAKLKGGSFVHGDFRANNIMVKPGEDESAVVIDFDWAGKDGEVNYPLYLNNREIEWPSEAGQAILSAHDRFLLEMEWDSLLKPWTT